MNDAAVELKDEVLYLYDGPPAFPPKKPFKMVRFASPNEVCLEGYASSMSHYVPMPDDPEQFDARVESKFVSLRVLERISSRNYQKRNEMPLYLHGIPTAAAFRGHVFVIKVHDILVCGCEIQTICISGIEIQGGSIFHVPRK
ncbi:hypothetical protein GQ600_9820 [Phytophthora cactorum]|nr:hypothetical protein GQ600_9820 [Phytophthora cactorum]